MLDWKRINDHSEIPGTPMGVRLKYYLAVHRSAQYTSDVYMIWRARSGEISRWPHLHLPITHIAEFNLPDTPECKYPPTHVQPEITSDLADLLEEEARVKSRDAEDGVS